MLTTVLNPIEAGAETAGFAEVAIFDDATSPGTVYSDVDRVQNPAFRGFVLAVLQQLGEHGIALRLHEAATGAEALRFVRIPVAASGDAVIAAPDLPTQPTYSVETPWADLAYDSKTGRLSGTIYWNERQILRDQALRAGLADVLRVPRGSIPRSAFDAAAEAYAGGMPMLAPSAAPDPNTPPELQWLFENVPQSTFEAFFISAHKNVQGFMVAAVGCYAGLVAELVKHCLQGGAPAVRVDELSDLGPLSKWVACELKH